MAKIIFSIIAVLIAALAIWISWFSEKFSGRSSSEIIRYAEQRLKGHPKLELISSPAIAAVRNQFERPVDADLPSLSKGQQAISLASQLYSPSGRPVENPSPSSRNNLPSDSTINVGSEPDLQRAIKEARPGQVIEIAPGTYLLKSSIRALNHGTADQPIVLRARAPKTVNIEFTAIEGFYVSAPYWVIENLKIRGSCKDDSACEHAFHIVGRAKGTVIRNNWVTDFNAHIKINGLNGDWPDEGLIQYNTLTNTRARNTGNPVTPIDVVGASHWRVADNVISNFVKGGGNQVSFGAFMKGAGQNGRFERNLVICTEKGISQPGARVGLSLGGGGTYPVTICRDQGCVTEHSEGIIVNNIIAHCNDVAVYVNKSNQTVVAHNTLINTTGVDIRFPSSSAGVYGNLLEGRARSRDGGIVESSSNLVTSLSSVFVAPDLLNLVWRKAPASIPTHAAVTDDFCRRARPAKSLPGAFAMATPCATTQ